MGLKIVDAVREPEAESDLVAACIRGDRLAERTLFRREYPRVNATVFRLLGATREADDLVQETFIAVFRALPAFRGEAKLSTWIDRIAVRVVFKHVAARKRQPIPLDIVPEQPNVDGSPRDRAAAREGLRRLYRVLAAFKPEARMAFALYAIDGRSIAEVATLTGTTRLVAKVRIWRARRELARCAAVDPVLAEFLAGVREEAR